MKMNNLDHELLESLINKYPNAEVVSVVHKVSERVFKSQCESHLSKQALGGAIGVVKTMDNQVVLVKRSGVHPGWALPGGMVESGEDFQGAFEREIAEEIGVKVTATRLIRIEKKQFVSPCGDELNFLLAVFSAEMVQGALPPEQTSHAKSEKIFASSFKYTDLPSPMVLNDEEKIDFFVKNHMPNSVSRYN